MTAQRGAPVRAGDIPVVWCIVKSAAQPIAATVTPQDDNDFVYTLTAGLWRAELFFHASCADAANNKDLRAKWTFSGSLNSSSRSCIGPGVSSINVAADNTTAGSGIMRSSSAAIGTDVSYGIESTVTSVVHEDLVLDVSAVGTLQFQWSQLNSGVTAVIGTTNSRLYLTQLTAV